MYVRHEYPLDIAYSENQIQLDASNYLIASGTKGWDLLGAMRRVDPTTWTEIDRWDNTANLNYHGCVHPVRDGDYLYFGGVWGWHLPSPPAHNYVAWCKLDLTTKGDTWEHSLTYEGYNIAGTAVGDGYLFLAITNYSISYILRINISTLALLDVLELVGVILASDEPHVLAYVDNHLYLACYDAAKRIYVPVYPTAMSVTHTWTEPSGNDSPTGIAVDGPADKVYVGMHNGPQTSPGKITVLEEADLTWDSDWTDIQDGTKPTALYVKDNHLFVTNDPPTGGPYYWFARVTDFSAGATLTLLEDWQSLDYHIDAPIMYLGAYLYVPNYSAGILQLASGAVQPSTVSTDPATGVSVYGGLLQATLNGTLDDDGGIACDCNFEWGETVAYGNETTPESHVTGETFAAELTGLDPTKTYHFRAKAVNSADTSYGIDRTFSIKKGNPNIDQRIFQHVESMD